MLAGRYPSDEFAELRPRIVWDRTAGVIRGRTGARRLAVTNAGTIPDRGLFGVHLVDGGGRVGELDEEMVYEARQGQTFMLGASTWRIEEITRDRVLVSPAPGVPGRGPVLEGRGRRPPVRAGREDRPRLARARRALRRQSALAQLGEDYHLDPRAAQNLLTFLREQAAATGVVPSDRTIVVERFRDEIGDWRVCILTPFGGRVHAPWAMALTARLRDSLGLEAQSIWSDDGIALHLPDADTPPSLADLLIGPDEIEELVVGEVGQTALFGARFRENAARALLIPRRRPGPADAALAAAAEGAEPAPGRAQVRLVPDRARDLPRVPAGRLRPARAEGHPQGAADARARSRRGRDGLGLAVRLVAPLRLRRDLHVRGRHAAGRAARAGALARPRPAARAARPGGAARADRPGRARRGRAAAARRPARPRRAARRPPPPRRPARGRVRRGAGGDPARRAARADGAGRRRGAAGRGRGRGPLPRRARRDAAGRAAGGVPRRAAPTRSASSSSATRKGRGPFTTARGRDAFRPRARAASCTTLERADLLVRGELRPGRHRARVVRPRRAAPPPARLARRAAPRGRAGRAGVLRPLPARLARDRPAREPARGARAAAGARAARSRSGRARCCRGACPATSPPGSTGSAPPGELVWVGAGPRPRRRLLPRGRAAARPAGRRAAAGDAGGGRAPRGARPQRHVLARPARRRPGSRPRRRCPRSGSSSGRARSRTTPGRRSGPAAATRRRGRSVDPRRFSRTRGASITLDPGPLVADRGSLPRDARPARARRAAARAAGHRHPRRRPRRRDSRAATAPSTRS